jgi:23S rRNA (guanosine2251-2'-O)-methyltransferase
VFAAGRIAHRLLVVPQRRAALEQIVLHATRLRSPIVELEGGSLTALAGFDGHQGIAVVVEPREFASLADVLARARTVTSRRSCSCSTRSRTRRTSARCCAAPRRPASTASCSRPSARRRSARLPSRRRPGAVEHLLLCPVDDLGGALADLHTHGLRVLGSEADAPLTARQTDLRGPLAIVVGSEGQGLGPAVRRRCDAFMRIPMRGAIGSLNAAVAGSILLFEAVAQRDPGGAASPPATASRARAAGKRRSAKATDHAEPPSEAPSDPIEGAAAELAPTDSRRPTLATDEPTDEADAADADLLPAGPAGDASTETPNADRDGRAPTHGPATKKRRAPARRTTPHA